MIAEKTVVTSIGSNSPSLFPLLCTTPWLDHSGTPADTQAKEEIKAFDPSAQLFFQSTNIHILPEFRRNSLLAANFMYSFEAPREC
jgi:hypothetical protein